MRCTQCAARAFPSASDGSFAGTSSVWAEVVSDPVLLSLVPSSMAPSGTISLSSGAASSLAPCVSSSSDALDFPRSRHKIKKCESNGQKGVHKAKLCIAHLLCLWC